MWTMHNMYSSTYGASAKNINIGLVDDAQFILYCILLLTGITFLLYPSYIVRLRIDEYNTYMYINTGR